MQAARSATRRGSGAGEGAWDGLSKDAGSAILPRGCAAMADENPARMYPFGNPDGVKHLYSLSRCLPLTRLSRVAFELVEKAYRGRGAITHAVSIRVLDFARTLLDTNGFERKRVVTRPLRPPHAAPPAL
ncbi:hypothetical protein SPHINGOAX6_10079 [Sphingomonas sp. AX6]|nr:hypothetical protein SPHINGOAX6_10079 [Sphingomonas sp. AX6]